MPADQSRSLKKYILDFLRVLGPTRDPQVGPTQKGKVSKVTAFGPDTAHFDLKWARPVESLEMVRSTGGHGWCAVIFMWRALTHSEWPPVDWLGIAAIYKVQYYPVGQRWFHRGPWVDHETQINGFPARKLHVVKSSVAWSYIRPPLSCSIPHTYVSITLQNKNLFRN